MPLHLNLYHEIQKTKALKRRDPLKISLYGLAAIAVAFASYFVLQMLQMHSLVERLDAVKGDYDKLAPVAKTSKKREDDLTLKVKATEALVQRIEGRFYWAPVLEQIMTAVPRQVQVTRLSGDLPIEGLRRCSITVDGLSAGSDPRKVAEELRTALAEAFKPKFKNVTSTFRTLEDGTEMVMLDGKQVPTATFAISLQLYISDGKPAITAPARVRR
jgi:Tfp pilus assembly protein PilN